MRRPLMSMQIPRYPSGCGGLQFNLLTLPIVRYRIQRMSRRIRLLRARLGE